MVEIYWPAVLISALSPLVFGAIWYSRPVFKIFNGFEWRNRKHSIWVYVVCYVMGIPLAMMMSGFLSTHPVEEQYATHGLFHGIMLGLFVVLPVFLVHFLFEGDRSTRNILYHVVYWIISIGIIGFIIFAWQ